MGGLLIFDIEATGLDPKVDQVVGVGFKNDKEEKVIVSKYEKTILKKFWEYLPNKDISLVSFDSDLMLPFVFPRELHIV